MATRLNNSLRVMITSGGGPGVWGLLSALRCLPQRETTLIVNDPSEKLTLGTSQADIAVRLPDASNPHYCDALTSICSEKSVDVLIPVYDGELIKVAKLRSDLAAQGTAVLLPNRTVVHTCVDKTATYQQLAHTGFVPSFAVANTLDETRDALATLGNSGRTLCIRPAISTGSRGVHIVSTKQPSFEQRMQQRLGPTTCTPPEFLSWRAAGPDHYPLLITEYLPGDELGIDLLADEGQLIDLCIRRKSSAHLHGNPREITFVEDDRVTTWARELAKTLHLSALTAIDARYNAAGELKLLEVNARPGAYIGLTCARRHLLARAIDRLLGEERDPACYELNPHISGGMRLFADATLSGEEMTILPTHAGEAVTGVLPR